MGIDDIWIDEGKCPTQVDKKCGPPLRPKKKTMYEEIFTGNWVCKNPKNGKKYNMTDPAVQMPQGTPCKMTCSNKREMAAPSRHGKIICGRRGWHRKELKFIRKLAIIFTVKI